MLSRVADTIYWLGRYMERTNGMLQVILTQYISSQDQASDFMWRPLLKIYGELSEDEIKSIETNSPKALEYMIFSHDNSASAYNNVMFSAKMREGSRIIFQKKYGNASMITIILYAMMI